MTDLQLRLRDWLHETPLTLCDMGSDTCPDWDLALPMARAIQTNADEDWDRLRELTKQRINDIAQYESAIETDRKKRLRCRMGFHRYTTIPQNVIAAARQAGIGKNPPMGFGHGGYVGSPGPVTCFDCGNPKPGPTIHVTIE